MRPMHFCWMLVVQTLWFVIPSLRVVAAEIVLDTPMSPPAWANMFIGLTIQAPKPPASAKPAAADPRSEVTRIPQGLP